MLYFEALYQLLLYFFNMQEFNQTISNLQHDVNQLQYSDSARNIWSVPAAGLTFCGVLLNTYLFCKQRPQLEAKKQQDERDMDLVLDTLGIEKGKPIEPIYPYEKILACCSSKYKDIVNSKQTNNAIKPNKQDIKEIIRLKILEMQQEDGNTSIVAQDGKNINLTKRITRSNSFETRTKSHDLEMFNSR